MKGKAQTQKNTLLKNAEANVKGIIFKRVLFSSIQEEIQIFFSPPFGFLISLGAIPRSFAAIKKHYHPKQYLVSLLRGCLFIYFSNAQSLTGQALLLQ